MTDIKKIFGGINSSKRIQYMIGGTMNKNSNKSIIYKNISNITQNEIQLKMIEYNAFKKQYLNNKIDIKYAMLLESLLYDILPFKCKSFEKEVTTIEKIEKLYKLNNIDFFHIIVEYFKVSDIKSVSYEIVFFSYKLLLEKLISIFIKLRTSICNDNDMVNLEKNWKEYDNSKNINTSSIFLYFIFNKIQSLPKYNWIIPDKKYKKLNNIIKIFLTKLNSIKYDYNGFCHYDIKNRIKSIFSFPIYELLKCIIEMDSKKKYKYIYDGIYELVDYLNVNKDYIKNRINIDKIVSLDKLNNIKLLNINRKLEKNTIDIYVNAIKYTFDSYIKFTPYLLLVENKFYELSIKIEKINNKIEKI